MLGGGSGKLYLDWMVAVAGWIGQPLKEGLGAFQVIAHYY
jgi:hypothetical protein